MRLRQKLNKNHASDTTIVQQVATKIFLQEMDLVTKIDLKEMEVQEVTTKIVLQVMDLVTKIDLKEMEVQEVTIKIVLKEMEVTKPIQTEEYLTPHLFFLMSKHL